MLEGLALDRKVTRTPWRNMKANPDQYHDQDQVPEGFEWDDPERMTREKVRCLLDFWAGHQEADTPPFVFKEPEEAVRAEEARQEGKKRACKLKKMKAAWVEVDSPEDSDESGDEGLFSSSHKQNLLI